MLNLNNSELYSDLKARSVFKSSDNDQRVKLLLNFDNSFEDESQYYHSFINVNNVSLNTNIKKFGNSSAYFNGSSYLYYKDSDEFFFGIDDFTIEFWFYPTNNSSDGQGIIGQRLDWNNDNSWYIYYQPLSNCFMFQYSLNSSSQTSISFGTIVSLNTWHHVAVCRSGSALNCFVDGTPYSYTISAYPLYNSSQPVRVGASMPTYYFTGYLDNLIIYKGLSKYSIQNNLSLPTEESIVTANTRLLIHGESYNKNTAGHTVTRYGDANINTSIYKFGDGSGYFDGSGDYLTIPYSSDFDFGTGDFTLEFNLKWPAASYQFLFGSSGISGAYHIALNYDNNANTICVGRHAVAWDTAFAINMPLNTWCHLVLQKKSGYLECYLDGYIIGRTANNISYNALGGPIHLMAHNSLTTYSGYVDEIRISKGIARYQYSNFTPSINAYETDQYTKLLLHAEESDNSTNFVDSSGVYKLILPINNTCLSTSQYKFSPSSLYLNGTNNYLTIPSYDCFNFGTEDFTIDCWVYITNTGSYFPLIEARPSASYSNFICGLYYISGAFKLDFVVSSGRLTSTSSIQLNQWQHIAFIRTSGILKCFINGTLDATTYSYSSNISYGRSSLYIGYNVDGNYLNGYIDELRVSKGIARWIENFTPPTEPYATDQYTKLLLHMTGTDATTAFIDSSDSPKTVTRYGDARLDAYNKIFGLSSGYFDGAGDYLTVPYSSDFDFGTGDFTIECWGYASSIPSVSRFCASGSQTDGGYRQWFFGWGTVWGTGTKINFGYYTGSGNVDYSSSAINISLNTWNHFAVTRYNNYINFFINGIPCGSVSISSGININSSTTVGLMIGARMNTNSSTIIELVTGYIDELRISKSIARWTSNFTPPTEQYTSDQYTKLLLHFDGENNAPFLTDSSNAPITLSPTGDAKIKTDNYKFGSSAMYFDGSVDCLTVPFSYDFILTTVDFTIDAWVRLNAMPTSDAFPTDWNSHMVVFFLGTINTGDGYGLVIGQTKLILNSNNTQIVSGTHNMVINTWYHVAVVRRNNFFYLFVNGSVVGQASSTVLMGTGSGVYVGNNKTQGAVFNGYIDELRVSKGIARWTANFTPPLSAHTTDQYTKLLMHFPSTDKNQSGKTITRYGDAKISTDQYKFGLSSGYFDGTGDYLTAQASTDFNFSSDNLTIDFWWYSTSSSRQWFFFNNI